MAKKSNKDHTEQSADEKQPASKPQKAAKENAPQKTDKTTAAQPQAPAQGQTPPQPQHEESDLYETRFAKLEELRRQGVDPYSLRFEKKHTAKQLTSKPDSEFGGDTVYQCAGRIRSKRLMGKAAFMDLEDETGRIQLYGKDELSNYELFKSLDLGDIVGVSGTLFITKTGQKSLHLKKLDLLAKCLRPLPVVKEAQGKVFDAFADKELRYRMRYVDMIVNPDVRETFMIRSKVVSEIRNFLTARDFLEVETPMMHPIPGGATARPFVTHHNALDMDLYLRIAPELYLKRLIVGGLPRVFEINRNFRNEGISYKHNPEFTMLELYEAYGNMDTMMELCEALITHVTQAAVGALKIPYGEHQIDLTPPWRRLTYLDSIKEYAGVTLTPDMGAEKARAAAVARGIRAEEVEGFTFWRVAEAMFDHFVEAHLIQPTMITGFPLELSPLAKSEPGNPEFVERFEPYIAGREIGNAFSELSDPI
ncbi:MAG: lysine--tRNA ligase, partial [Spirochaetia bacterium]|nr:lysine--tRNA ligase [Spirochaetia bacterium]